MDRQISLFSDLRQISAMRSAIGYHGNSATAAAVAAYYSACFGTAEQWWEELSHDLIRFRPKLSELRVVRAPIA